MCQKTPSEDVVSRSCAMGTLAHRQHPCFETKPGFLCNCLEEKGGVGLWAVHHPKLAANFDHLGMKLQLLTNYLAPVYRQQSLSRGD